MPRKSARGIAGHNYNPAVAYNDIGFRLLSWLSNEGSDENLLISPLGAAFSLSLAANGAGGSTLAEMAAILGWEGLSPAQANEANRALRRALLGPEEVGLRGGKEAGPAAMQVTDAIWTAPGTILKEDFVKAVGKFYGALFFSADESDGSALESINRLISEKTGGKIGNMIRQEDLAGTVLIILNAVYFKGTWEERFDPDKTREGIFRGGAGKDKPHPMMSQSGRYQYYEDRTIQAIRLPFSAPGLGMYILLPRKGTELMQALGSLNSRSWQGLLAKMAPRKGEIVLPRFRVEHKARLDDALRALGVKEAFGPGADFSGMSPEGMFISRAMQSCLLEVDEMGAEAAAATAVVMARQLDLFEERFSMVADHPFFFAAGDENTGAILFMGCLMQPD